MYKFLLFFLICFLNINLSSAQTPRVHTIQIDADNHILPEGGSWVSDNKINDVSGLTGGRWFRTDGKTWKNLSNGDSVISFNLGIRNLWLNKENGDIAVGANVSQASIQQFIQSVNNLNVQTSKRYADESDRRNKFSIAFCEKNFNKNTVTAGYFEDLGRYYSVNPNSISFSRTVVGSNRLGQPVCDLIFYTPKGPKTCKADFRDDWKSFDFRCE